MCGIAGYLGNKLVVPLLLEALRILEYRGYDSAGVAVGNGGEFLELRRATGKPCNLEQVVRQRPAEGSYGIGHTRWATHGRPTEENAHPHRDCLGQIALVHNGIVENCMDLKRGLRAEGHRFLTETDTEIIAHQIEKKMRANGTGKSVSLEEAMRQALIELKGVFAVAAISARDPNKIVAARQGPPVVVGLGEKEFFVASDITALLLHTRDFFLLADGDFAVLIQSSFQRDINNPIKSSDGSGEVSIAFEVPQCLNQTICDSFQTVED